MVLVLEFRQLKMESRLNGLIQPQLCLTLNNYTQLEVLREQE